MEINLFLMTILLLVSVVFCKHEKKKILENFQSRRQNECTEITRVDPDIIKKLRNGDWNGSNTPEVRDWCLCVLMKSGLMTKEGVYKLEVLARIPDQDRDTVEDQIDKCLTPKALPAKIIAYKFMKCFQKTESEWSGIISGI